MNNMNFRLQANCQNTNNCNCSSQNHAQSQGCSRCPQNPNQPQGCSRCQQNPNQSQGCSRCQQNPNQSQGCDRPPHHHHESCEDAISHVDMHDLPLGIGYVPWQKWRNIYALCEGLSRGTIFKELDYPFYGCVPNGLCNQKGGAR